MGLTEENKIREVNEYLESKGVNDIEEKESFKNNPEFLNLLEDKILTEVGINVIKDDIESLPAEYMELNDEQKIVSYVGSDNYNKALNELENKLEKEETNLNEINNSLDKIIGKDNIELSNISDLIDKATEKNNSINKESKVIDFER